MSEPTRTTLTHAEILALLARVDADLLAGNGIHRHDEDTLVEALRQMVATLQHLGDRFRDCDVGFEVYQKITEAQLRGAAHLQAQLEESQRVFLAQLREAELEIAAYQGRPEGGLPGWKWVSDGVLTRGYWEKFYRAESGVSSIYLQVAPVVGSWDVPWNYYFITPQPQGRPHYRYAAGGVAPTPRKSMKNAEEKAKSLGLIPVVPPTPTPEGGSDAR